MPKEMEAALHESSKLARALGVTLWEVGRATEPGTKVGILAVALPT